MRKFIPLPVRACTEDGTASCSSSNWYSCSVSNPGTQSYLGFLSRVFHIFVSMKSGQCAQLGHAKHQFGRLHLRPGQDCELLGLLRCL